MKKGYLCESCNSFNESDLWVFKCRICNNDACNSCANEQLCEKCWDKFMKGELDYTLTEYDDEQKAVWVKNI